MENVREFKLKINNKFKFYSNIEMHKKMFYLMLNHSIDEVEQEIREGKTLSHEEVFKDLLGNYYKKI